MSFYVELFLQKARNFCVYQERCNYDVRRKLEAWMLNEETIGKIILLLNREGFIDEERYARIFALGKMRNNNWGRNKIIYALNKKNISESYIDVGLSEIDEEEYINVLKVVLSSKKVEGESEYIRKNKLIKYATQKGFQPELSRKILNGEL